MKTCPSTVRALFAGLFAGLLVSLTACQTPLPPTGVTRLPGPFGGTASPTPSAAAEPAQPAVAVLAGERPSYRIQINDELEVQFADQPGYDQTVRVRPDGRVTLRMIGTVAVLGRSAEDVQAELLQRYQALSGGIGERSYLIRAGDELEIKFPYNAQLNEVLKVRPDGKLMLPLAGTLVAQGRSPEELQAELEKRYAKVLKKPQLAVVMRNFTSQSVRVGQGASQALARSGTDQLHPVVAVKSFAPEQIFVGGEVGRPGMLAMRPGLTLLQALVESGGQLSTGELRSVMVLRRGNGREPLVIRRDLSLDLAGRGSQDLALEPFDVVVLPRSAIATLTDTLNQYVFNLLPPIRNSSFSFAYDIRK